MRIFQFQDEEKIKDAEDFIDADPLKLRSEGRDCKQVPEHVVVGSKTSHSHRQSIHHVSGLLK